MKPKYFYFVNNSELIKVLAVDDINIKYEKYDIQIIFNEVANNTNKLIAFKKSDKTTQNINKVCNMKKPINIKKELLEDTKHNYILIFPNKSNKGVKIRAVPEIVITLIYIKYFLDV